MSSSQAGEARDQESTSLRGFRVSVRMPLVRVIRKYRFRLEDEGLELSCGNGSSGQPKFTQAPCSENRGRKATQRAAPAVGTKVQHHPFHQDSTTRHASRGELRRGPRTGAAGDKRQQGKTRGGCHCRLSAADVDRHDRHRGAWYSSGLVLVLFEEGGERQQAPSTHQVSAGRLGGPLTPMAAHSTDANSMHLCPRAPARAALPHTSNGSPSAAQRRARSIDAPVCRVAEHRRQRDPSAWQSNGS